MGCPALVIPMTVRKPAWRNLGDRSREWLDVVAAHGAMFFLLLLIIHASWRDVTRGGVKVTIMIGVRKEVWRFAGYV